MGEAGFENIEVKDFSVNVLPTLRLFYVLAIIPYFIVSFLGWSPEVRGKTDFQVMSLMKHSLKVPCDCAASPGYN